MQPMIQFFKRIRQKFIFDNKVRKYLLYAIGEILLVVIGILIALAINNANQKRIIREKEQTYLVGLREEFRTSRLKLQELIDVNHKNLEGAKRLLKFMSDESSVPGEKELSELLYNTFAFDVAFNPNNSILNEMISSGSLKDISNDGLRMHLTNWISTLEDVVRQEDELSVIREKVLDILRSDEYSLRTILDRAGISDNAIGLPAGPESISNLKLLNSMEFENNVLMFVLTSLATETAHYNPLMQNLDNILDLLDTEIKN